MSVEVTAKYRADGGIDILSVREHPQADPHVKAPLPAQAGGGLLPCPFCGSTRVGFHTEHDMDGFGVFRCIECRDCHGRGRLHYVSVGNDCPLHYQEVRDSWNRRAPLSAQVIR